MTFKSGFVAILGRPNVGKSTFLNHVMGQKIAIMSDKAQTTRNKIMGIYTTDKEQIVFIDTPGIHKPKTALGDFMVESAYSTLREVDTVLFMVPADEARGKGDDMIIERLKAAKVPVILVVNKIDKVHPDQLLAQIDDFRSQMDFKEIVPISALQDLDLFGMGFGIFTGQIILTPTAGAGQLNFNSHVRLSLSNTF